MPYQFLCFEQCLKRKIRLSSVWTSCVVGTVLGHCMPKLNLHYCFWFIKFCQLVLKMKHPSRYHYALISCIFCKEHTKTVIIVSCCHVSEATAVIIGCGSYNKSSFFGLCGCSVLLAWSAVLLFWGYETDTLSIVQVLIIDRYVTWMCATCVNLLCCVLSACLCWLTNAVWWTGSWEQ